MSKTWMVVKALVTLIVVGLLVVGGLALFHTGWSQGYAAGQLAAQGAEGTAPLYPPHPVGYGLRPFGLAPLLLAGGLLLLLLAVVGKVFRLLMWKHVMAGGPWPPGARWARRWHRFHGPVSHGPMHHGPVPPWCWGWEGPPGEEAQGPGAEADDAAAPNGAGA